MKPEPKKKPKDDEIHAGARVDAALHRQLLRRLFDEKRSFREWLQCMEKQYLRCRNPLQE